MSKREWKLFVVKMLESIRLIKFCNGFEQVPNLLPPLKISMHGQRIWQSEKEWQAHALEPKRLENSRHRCGKKPDKF
jgi:hypothetical protein